MNPFPKERLKLSNFTATLFEPGEWTCFSNTPYGTDVCPVEQGADAPTAYFSINALRPGSKRLDLNVVSFRNFLIECDSGPLKEQMDYINALQVPWATLVFSGSKSLHFVISLKEPLARREEYAAMARRIHKVIKQCDHTTKNPSRFSRFPGHLRVDKDNKEQHLLALRSRVGYDEIDSWLNAHHAPYEEPKTTIAAIEIMEGMRLPFNSFTKWFLNNGADPGQRNKQLYLAAHNIRECGYTYEEAIDALELSPLINERDFSRKEFERTILSAFQKNIG